MEGFIALALFAEQMSNLQEKPCSTQHGHNRPSSNQPDEALLSIQNSALAASHCQVQVNGTPMATESRGSYRPAREDQSPAITDGTYET